MAEGYYKPVEVSNATIYTPQDGYQSKPDAIKALYSFESYARQTKDEFSVVNSLDTSETD